VELFLRGRDHSHPALAVFGIRARPFVGPICLAQPLADEPGSLAPRRQVEAKSVTRFPNLRERHGTPRGVEQTDGKGIPSTSHLVGHRFGMARGISDRTGPRTRDHRLSGREHRDKRGGDGQEKARKSGAHQNRFAHKIITAPTSSMIRARSKRCGAGGAWRVGCGR